MLSLLNSPDVLPLTGKRKEFSKQDLYFMLQNEIYAGTYVRRIGADKRHKVTSPETIRVPGGVPAIITEDEWRRACEIRQYNSSASAAYRALDVYPLSGKVRCSVCGSNMAVRHGGKTRSGEVERYYICPRRCVVAPRVVAVENAAFAAIEYFLSDETIIQRACDVANSFTDASRNVDLAQVPAIKQRLLEVVHVICKVVFEYDGRIVFTRFDPVYRVSR